MTDGKGGRRLQISASPTAHPPQTQGTSEFKIPIGRMNYKERQALRDDMERLDNSRETKIAAKRKVAHERFLADFEEKKREYQEKVAQRDRRIEEERKVRLVEILEKRQVERNSKLKIQQVFDQRACKIEEKIQKREEQWDDGVKEVLAKAKRDKDDSEAAVAEIMQKAREREAAAKKLADEEYAEVQHLDEIRNRAIVDRIERVKRKEMVYITKIAAMKEASSHSLEVIKEKRLNAAFEANLARKKEYDAAGNGAKPVWAKTTSGYGTVQAYDPTKQVFTVHLSEGDMGTLDVHKKECTVLKSLPVEAKKELEQKRIAALQPQIQNEETESESDEAPQVDPNDHKHEYAAIIEREKRLAELAARRERHIRHAERARNKSMGDKVREQKKARSMAEQKEADKLEARAQAREERARTDKEKQELERLRVDKLSQLRDERVAAKAAKRFMDPVD